MEDENKYKPYENYDPNSKDDRSEELIFDSDLESGNLDYVGKVSEFEYDLLMRLDSNS